ncbi:hypothetical protein DSO57_1008707 [Entomophthora muscae]|uniref:Uncharacterized protein n=1 Tax=Entomophthora muscae TaxID=34485 RepID=A0ACC2SW09_9FUNG|nr:hypothetical protein DSO57_1008707 [Entomophthora muscae]
MSAPLPLVFLMLAICYMVGYHFPSENVSLDFHGAFPQLQSLSINRRSQWVPGVENVPNLEFHKAYACRGDKIPTYTKCIKILKAEYFFKDGYRKTFASCTHDSSCSINLELELPSEPVVNQTSISPWLLYDIVDSNVYTPSINLEHEEVVPSYSYAFILYKPLYIHVVYEVFRSNGTATEFLTLPQGNSSLLAYTNNGRQQFLFERFTTNIPSET